MATFSIFFNFLQRYLLLCEYLFQSTFTVFVLFGTILGILYQILWYFEQFWWYLQYFPQSYHRWVNELLSSPMQLIIIWTLNILWKKFSSLIPNMTIFMFSDQLWNWVTNKGGWVVFHRVIVLTYVSLRVRIRLISNRVGDWINYLSMSKKGTFVNNLHFTSIDSLQFRESSSIGLHAKIPTYAYVLEHLSSYKNIFWKFHLLYIHFYYINDHFPN